MIITTLTGTFIILGYIISIFIARWLNKKAYELDKNYVLIIPGFWFIPFVNIVFCTVIFIDSYFDKYKKNWFTGKHW